VRGEKEASRSPRSVGGQAVVSLPLRRPLRRRESGGNPDLCLRRVNSRVRSPFGGDLVEVLPAFGVGPLQLDLHPGGVVGVAGELAGGSLALGGTGEVAVLALLGLLVLWFLRCFGGARLRRRRGNLEVCATA
jgi:hypothetical protein